MTVDNGRKARKSPVGDDKGPVRESSYSALASAANVSLLVSRLDVKGALTSISVSGDLQSLGHTIAIGDVLELTTASRTWSWKF